MADSLPGHETSSALNEYEERRMQYLRCSGMHTESVTTLVHRICSGENFGPGIALVAPALSARATMTRCIVACGYGDSVVGISCTREHAPLPA